MKIKIKPLVEGPGPSEVVVGFVTFEGRNEEVVVDKSLIDGNFLKVGPVLTTQGDRALIELPRESASGRIRFWISSAEILKEIAA